MTPLDRARNIASIVYWLSCSAAALVWMRVGLEAIKALRRFPG